MKKTLLLCLALSSFDLILARADDKVDFAKTIQPILEKRCLECHGPKKHKASLRFDTQESALKGGDDGKVIEPGKPGDSDMVRRISLPAGDDDIMPPKGDPLTKEQIASIKKWIAEGADWPKGLVLGGEKEKKEEAKASGAKGSASAKNKKAPGQEFANLTPTKDKAAEDEAIKKLAALGISVRPIAQNLPWKEAIIRPQDTNKTEDAIALLKDIPSLVDLNMAKLNLKDDDLKDIASLSNLQRLHLENNPLGDAALAHLKGLTNLEYLNLYNTHVGDEGVENLQGLTNLMALYLWETKVSDEGADKLKKALPDALINRGEELKLVAKADEKKDEKAEEKKEDKPAEKKKEAPKKDNSKKDAEKKA